MKLHARLISSVQASPLLGRPAGAVLHATRSLASIPRYARDWVSYSRMNGAERLRLRDANPQLADRLAASPYDPHYFQQAVWAAERIFANDPAAHTDIGSELIFAGMLAARMPVTFADIRPLDLSIAQLRPVTADILALPFPDRSIASLSCLHVVEHVGLGRYGDALNPSGSREAVRELQRVLAPGGNLYLSLPIGRPRVSFNAHRIHYPTNVMGWMDGLELAEFSAVDDEGKLHLGAHIAAMTELRYGCGLFWFRRPVD